jgi:aldehyde dehydrogenase (NAD+)
VVKEYQLFINGSYQDASSGKLADDFNPWTGEVYAKVQQANKADAAVALNNAQEAFELWRNVGPTERESVFLKAADIMVQRADELKEILIDEQGATMLKAGYETHHAPTFLRSIAGECRRVTGQTYLSDYPGVKSYSIRRPLGIVLAISPFNFPLLLSIRKIGWALASGNCVILKPSEVTPVIGLKIAEFL